MATRITQRDIEALDQRNDTSLLRTLEMAVDDCITTQGYAIQFWNDVRLYGVREAYTYLVRSGYSDKNKWEGVRKVVEQIESAMPMRKYPLAWV